MAERSCEKILPLKLKLKYNMLLMDLLKLMTVGWRIILIVFLILGVCGFLWVFNLEVLSWGDKPYAIPLCIVLIVLCPISVVMLIVADDLTKGIGEKTEARRKLIQSIKAKIQASCEHVFDGCKCKKCGYVRSDGHNWNGCRCRICGHVRDEGHKWIPGGVKDLYCYKCSECNHMRPHEYGSDGACVNCGHYNSHNDEFFY